MKTDRVIPTYQPKQVSVFNNDDFYIDLDIRRNIHVVFINATSFDEDEEILIDTSQLQDEIKKEVRQEMKQVWKNQEKKQ